MKKRTRKTKFYVVVIVTAGKTISGRSDGDWGSFIGTDKQEVIVRALKAKTRWERGPYGPYEAYIGTLTEKATTPQVYRLTSL